MQYSYSCQIQQFHQIPLSVSHQKLMIVFVLSGSCSVKRFSSIKDFHEGEVFFINQDEVYAVISESGCIVEWIEFDAENLNQDEFSLMHRMTLMDSLGSLDQEKEMAEIYRDCVFLKNLIRLALEPENESCVQEICDALISDYNVLNHLKHNVSYVNEVQMNWMHQITDVLLQNLNQKISLQEMADCVGMQKNYFATQFKGLTGMTLLEYINQLRLKKAEELLLFSDMSHSEIIRECGFSDSKYFYRYFMDEFQMTPAAWKEKMKNLQNRQVQEMSANEAELILKAIQEDLSGLKTETDLYRKYSLMKHLERCNLLQKDTILEVDLMHPDNYIEAAGERMNAWYGFDLIMNEIRKVQFTAELRIHLDSKVTQEDIDELFKLLKQSASRFSSKVMKCWKFVIVFESVEQISWTKQIQKRIEKELEIQNCLIKCV